MKAYAQYYQRHNGVLQETCGSFGVIILDGRMNLQSMKEVAAEHCVKRKYEAYRIYRGNFRQSTAATEIIEVKHESS